MLRRSDQEALRQAGFYSLIDDPPPDATEPQDDAPPATDEASPNNDPATPAAARSSVLRPPAYEEDIAAIDDWYVAQGWPPARTG
jgi:hypothetical protein